MRFDEVNEKGGIHGRKIKLIVEDTQYQVPRAVQAGNKLLNRDNIFLMVSALGTPQNNAVLTEQLKMNVPNMFPVTAARQMVEPLHRLKFAGLGSYYDQVRAAVKYFVEQRGKKAVCMLYQDTEFGEEIRDGVVDQAKAMNIRVVESATNKPTDTDLTAQVTKLRAANCDLVALGTIVRDSIVPYVTARKMGWTNVDFVGTSATYIGAVAEVPGGATNGLYTMAGTIMPLRRTAPPNVLAWMDKFKTKYGDEPNISSVYGYVNMDQVAIGLHNAGPNLTLDSFIAGMEKITGYRDIFGGPVQSYGPNKRAGSNSSFMFVVKDGEWQLLNPEPMIY
jgi:branched-chain amino acid transport system substrate-binding protein